MCVCVCLVMRERVCVFSPFCGLPRELEKSLTDQGFYAARLGEPSKSGREEAGIAV